MRLRRKKKPPINTPATRRAAHIVHMMELSELLPPRWLPELDAELEDGT